MPTKLWTVRNDTKKRFEDIRIMLDILNKDTQVSSQLILKSSLMLMIYNVVEGTMSNLLTELFDFIVQKKLSIDVLPEKLQTTIYTYYLKNIGSNSNKLKEFVTYDKIKICNISYLDINKYLKLFSGNLDSKSIRDISGKLGINLPTGIDEPVLLNVKNNRNKLAHGETNFCKACQDITLEEMESICCKVEIYLEKIITTYENFFNRIESEQIL